MTARRCDGWWALEIEGVPGGHTQVKRLNQAEDTVRDLLSSRLGGSVERVGVTVEIVLDDFVRHHLERARVLREQAAAAQSQAAAEYRAAARLMHDGGIPLRDIGRVLGVSYQRVQQLIATG